MAQWPAGGDSNTSPLMPAIITSLTQTDGLLEFPEETTSIARGDHVGFLSYAVLMD